MILDRRYWRETQANGVGPIRIVGFQHDPAQKNPERLSYWYCPTCGSRHPTSREIQQLQSKVSELLEISEMWRESARLNTERALAAEAQLARYEREVGS